MSELGGTLREAPSDLDPALPSQGPKVSDQPEPRAASQVLALRASSLGRAPRRSSARTGWGAPSVSIRAEGGEAVRAGGTRRLLALAGGPGLGGLARQRALLPAWGCWLPCPYWYSRPPRGPDRALGPRAGGGALGRACCACPRRLSARVAAPPARGQCKGISTFFLGSSPTPRDSVYP